MYKRGILLLSIFILIFSFSVNAIDRPCPDFRIYPNSEFMCMGGNFPYCADAGANNRICKGPDYTCEGMEGIMNGDFSCVRCNSEGGYLGLVGRGRGCTLCGNNRLDNGEDCEYDVDGRVMWIDNDNDACNDLSNEDNVRYEGGNLRCNRARCRFDTSSCHTCGNNQRDRGEVCDGTDLDGETCRSLYFGYMVGNQLRCADDCNAFDTSNCISEIMPGTVFTTHQTYTGNLGGLNGADAICQSSASRARLEGTWIALLDYLYERSEPGQPGRLLNPGAASRIPMSFNGPIYNRIQDIVSDTLGTGMEDEGGDRRISLGLFRNRRDEEGNIMGEIGDEGGAPPYHDLSYNELGDRIESYTNEYGQRIEERFVWLGSMWGNCVNHIIEIQNNQYVRNEINNQLPDTTLCDDRERNVIGEMRGGDIGDIIERDDILGWNYDVRGGACVGLSSNVELLTNYAFESCRYDASLYCMKLPREIEFNIENIRICEKSDARFRIRLINNGADITNVRIVDIISKVEEDFGVEGRDVDVRRLSGYCDDLVIRGGGCSVEFSVSNLEDGTYVHNPYALVGNGEVLYGYERVGQDVINEIRVLDEAVAGCCTPETEYRRNYDNRVCCDGMPENYVPPAEGPAEGRLRRIDAACGCPNLLVWDVRTQACVPGGQICYSANVETGEVDERLPCISRWFRENWWGDAFRVDNLIELQNCFRFHRENEPITQTCCPYMEYEGREYGEYQAIEIY